MKLINKFLSAAFVMPLLLCSAQAGTLTGDNINITHNILLGSWMYPYWDMGTAVAPSSVYTYQSGVYTAQVSANSIEFSFSCYQCTWSNFDGFNGPVVTNLTRPAFLDVTIDPSTNYSGFNASRLSFTGDQIFVNLANLSINGYIKLNITASDALGGGPSSVPEPGTIGAAAAGLAGLALALRRRQAQ